MTAYALIFINFPAGATIDEVIVLNKLCLRVCVVPKRSAQVPANLTSISGMEPSRPVALTTSFLLGFSDACFITQVRGG